MNMIKLITNILLTLSSLAYPIVWLFLTENNGLLLIIPYIMALLWAIKAILQPVVWHRYFAFFMALLLAVIGVTRSLDTMYWYPVIISGLMLIIFGGSLFDSQTVIERLARLKTPDLPPQGVLYTRNVTKVWVVFFIFNIIVSTSLILLEYYQFWALFTGVISYILMGIIMGVEYCIRQIVIKKYNI